MSSNPCIYMDYGAGDHYNGRLWLRAAVWLQVKVRERRLELRPMLNADHVCDALSLRQLLWLVFDT